MTENLRVRRKKLSPEESHGLCAVAGVNCIRRVLPMGAARVRFVNPPITHLPLPPSSSTTMTTTQTRPPPGIKIYNAVYSSVQV